MPTAAPVTNLLVQETMQNLRKVVKAIEDYSHRVERHFGLTGPQLWALWELGRNGPMSLKGLSEHMHLDPSTLVGVIDRLVAKDLVLRSQDPDDRRKVSLCPTKKGLELLEHAPHPAQGYLLSGFRRMDSDRLGEVHASLATLVRVLEAEHLNPPFFFSEE